MKLRGLLAALLFALPASAGPQLAVTFDDLPAHSVLPPGSTRVEIAKATIAALKAAKAPATGFVNASLLQGEPEAAPVLTLWHEAGFALGNHTWSHKNANDLTLAQYQDEIVRNEPLLAETAAGSDGRWFRYPFLSEGNTAETRTAIRTFLAGRGYWIAPATMMFGDWSYSEPYARCLAKRDTAAIARLEEDYFAAADANIAYSRRLSQTLYGRDIPYVLLMHIGGFEARTLPRLLTLFREKGFSFISLEEAERDPFYKAYADPSLPAPAGFDEQLRAKGVTLPAPKDYGPELAVSCR
jgi:peptidoglycan-N-acetylglucosamine deacetylase